MNNSANRIPGLDGLRAISIIIVIISHVWAGKTFPDKFYLTGNLGVRFFFVISGFLITSILVNELKKNSAVNLKKFYLRRAFRIFPAYFFFLGVLFLLNAAVNTQSLLIFIFPLTYTSNYFFSDVSPELAHTWSLAVEEQFYLIFPIFLSFYGLKKFKRFILAVILIVPILRIITQTVPALLGLPSVLTPYGDYQFISIAWNFHTNADILASGCLLALHRNSWHTNKLYRHFLNSSALFATLLTLIIFLGYFAESHLTLFYGIGMTMMNFSIVLCIDWLIINHQSVCGKLLNLPPLRYVGVLSYSIYLWQQPFVCYPEIMTWEYFPYNLIFPLCIVFSYHCVEKTFLRYRQEIENKHFPKSSIEPVLAT